MTITDTTSPQTDLWVANRDLKIAQSSLDSTKDELKKAQNDFKVVAAALLTEAKERDWCNDYNDFVEKVNDQLQVSSLDKVVYDFTATITLTVSFECGKGAEHDTASSIATALHHYGDNLGCELYVITDSEYSDVD